MSDTDTTHERRAFGLRVPGPGHPDLRRLKRRHNPRAQGHRTWSATWVLMDFLSRLALPRGLRVLDAGCGWGLVSVFCARRFKARVLAADVDADVFPFLRLHARLNRVSIRTLEASFAQIPDRVLVSQDLLVGADICFRPAMVAPLYHLLRGAWEAGALALLADPGRPAFRELSALSGEALGARLLDWQTEEPLLEWPGARPPLRGQLLLLGDFSRSLA